MAGNRETEKPHVRPCKKAHGRDVSYKKREKRRLDPFGMLRASDSATNSDGGMSTAEGCRWDFADAPFVPQGRRDKLRSFR
jgi:hypothetical protein